MKYSVSNIIALTDEKYGNLKGVADVVLDGCVTIKGVKIINGEKGLFVGMPSYEGSNGEYHDRFYPVTADERTALNKAVLDAYTNKINDLEKNKNLEVNISSVNFFKNNRDDMPNLIGNASICLSNSFKLSSVQLYKNQKDELFLSFPSYKDSDGNYRDLVTVNKKMREVMTKKIIECYEQRKNQQVQKSTNVKEQEAPAPER